MSKYISSSENSSSRSEISNPEGKSSKYWTASCDGRHLLVVLIYKWKKKNFLGHYFLSIYFAIKKKLSTTLLKKLKIIAFHSHYEAMLHICNILV